MTDADDEYVLGLLWDAVHDGWSAPCVVCGQRLTADDFRRKRVICTTTMLHDDDGGDRIRIDAACCFEHVQTPGPQYHAAYRALARETFRAIRDDDE